MQDWREYPRGFNSEKKVVFDEIPYWVRTNEQNEDYNDLLALAARMPGALCILAEREESHYLLIELDSNVVNHYTSEIVSLLDEYCDARKCFVCDIVFSNENTRGVRYSAFIEK